MKIQFDKVEEKLNPRAAQKLMKRFGRRALEWPFRKGEVQEMSSIS